MLNTAKIISALSLFSLEIDLNLNTVELAQFVTFSSVPAESPSFVYISVRLIRHRLIRQFA